jgi:RNA polymerase sigma factor (sigma-70 family)
MTEAVSSSSAARIRLPLRLLGERQLARLAAKGDQRAFAAIYERYHQPLYRYCRSILGDPEDARDALQNTMLKALRALPGEQRDLQLRPWLYRIAHNESVELLRQRRPKAQLSDAQSIGVPGAEKEAAGNERMRQLFADLHEMPERQRGALVMRELSGLSCAEIAVALGTSPAVAKQTIYEARMSLQEMAEGREMDCEAIRCSLSEDDRRVLRGRRVRAHLRACAGCRDFASAIPARRAELAALSPPLPAFAAAAVLNNLLGAGHGGGGGGLLGLLGGGSGKALVGSAALKVAAVVAVTAGLGLGAAAATKTLGGSASRAAAEQPSSAIAGSKASFARSAADRAAGEHSLRSVHRAKQQSQAGPLIGSASDRGQSGAARSRGQEPAGGSESGHRVGGGATPSPGGPPSELPAASNNGQQQAASHAPTPPTPAQDHPTPPPTPAAPPTPPTPPTQVGEPGPPSVQAPTPPASPSPRDMRRSRMPSSA